MACLDMYNSDQHKGHHCPAMSPRISFSNDFVDAQQMMKQQERSPLSHPPASSDFEFSVTGYSMMSADELFSKGRLLPFKDNGGSSQMQRTTIRDQLLVDEDGDVEVSPRPPRGSSSTRWKGLLGLRRSHIGSKKVERVNSNGGQISVGEMSRRPGSGSFVREQDHQLVHVSNGSSQEALSEGGSGCRDLEIGI
ncbi:unnamed protein product [Linum trigynum]|uniref:Uncharacterized protein n=1 Tax=Linum trigynum TaxID=586398 RepID=A0AAV2GGV9_9ROSI